MGEKGGLDVVMASLSERVENYDKTRPKNDIDADLTIIRCLRYLRETRRMSFLEIQELMDVSDSTILRWRNGVLPSGEKMCKKALLTIKKGLERLQEMDKERRIEKKKGELKGK
jgi:hypothetical protein